MEIQKHILNSQENVWLSLFLAREEFAVYQKVRLQIKETAEKFAL
jgi:hypothetical protein